MHKNTLVTARAGSGKTRVIVAKIVYLVAQCGYDFDEIQVFMFNRTAATEVNQRISAVKVDGKTLPEFRHNDSITAQQESPEIKVASTFHKFAYDLLRQNDQKFQLISEHNQQQLIRKSLDAALCRNNTNAAIGKTHIELLRTWGISAERYADLLKITTSFAVRAGQKYPDGKHDIPDKELTTAERLGFQVFRNYLCYLSEQSTEREHIIDFNILMNQAATIMQRCEQKANTRNNPDKAQNPCAAIQKLRYIMVDEYQDFSYLFWQLIMAIRGLAAGAHLFVVGDDWQAINRFAGSDVGYFLNFTKFFPEDCAKLPISTNYRSDKAIVEEANRFMLSRYDPQALPAQPFSRQTGQVKWRNFAKVRFNIKDHLEDGRGDGRFVRALANTTGSDWSKVPIPAAKLLKTCYQIIAKHPRQTIMLLHRHNFTTFMGVSLENFQQALSQVCIENCILDATGFTRRVRVMTMHKSKGLEADVVILLEFDQKLLLSHHQHAGLFPKLGDSAATELADNQRLIYVALTRAKKRLYLLSQESQNFLR